MNHAVSNISHPRISWRKIWMELAQNIARRSCDTKLQVGCVIVSDDNTRVLALGYNGDEKGGKNQRISEIAGQSGFIHAEINALVKCDYNHPSKKIMYITHSPCDICAKVIINANISSVIYKNEFRDISGIEILKNAGIEVVQYI